MLRLWHRPEARSDGDYYVIKGIDDFPVALEGASMEDKIQGEIKKPAGHRQADTRPGAWDPIARRADMDLDNLRAEIVYPGAFGLQFWHAPDPEYWLACMQVYNDWLSEFCSAMPDRLVGAGLLPMGGPIEWTIREAERAAKCGLRTFLIPSKNVHTTAVNMIPFGQRWRKSACRLVRTPARKPGKAYLQK